jgi:chromosome segregation ATPase
LRRRSRPFFSTIVIKSAKVTRDCDRKKLEANIAAGQKAAEVRKRIARIAVRQEKIKSSIIYIDEKFKEKQIRLQEKIKRMEELYKSHISDMQQLLKELENEKKDRIKDLENDVRALQKEAADLERR